MSVPASWAAPGFGFGGPENKAYTDFECLPPVSVVDFDKHLREGKLENAIPWQVLAGVKMDSTSRLAFNQGIGFEFVSGTLISVQDEDPMEHRAADALTGTKYTLNLLQQGRLQRHLLRSPQREGPLISALEALNEEHHLFRIQSEGNFEDLESRVYGKLIQPGTLIFTHESGGLILSPDRSQISVCVKMDQYESTEQYYEWLAIEPARFEGSALVDIAFHFTNDPAIAAILKCDELMLPR